jgi:hypothetical protein
MFVALLGGAVAAAFEQRRDGLTAGEGLQFAISIVAVPTMAAGAAAGAAHRRRPRRVFAGGRSRLPAWALGVATAIVSLAWAAREFSTLPPAVPMTSPAVATTMRQLGLVPATNSILAAPPPDSLILAVTAAGSAWLLLRLLGGHVRPGRCSTCGYDISASLAFGRCPECGRTLAPLGRG